MAKKTVAVPPEIRDMINRWLDMRRYSPLENTRATKLGEAESCVVGLRHSIIVLHDIVAQAIDNGAFQGEKTIYRRGRPARPKRDSGTAEILASVQWSLDNVEIQRVLHDNQCLREETTVVAPRDAPGYVGRAVVRGAGGQIEPAFDDIIRLARKIDPAATVGQITDMILASTAASIFSSRYSDPDREVADALGLDREDGRGYTRDKLRSRVRKSLNRLFPPEKRKPAPKKSASRAGARTLKKRH